ncbi:Hypothetical_protein [Hexamita inflata]|uniref:Hypothetical_protein n=1 Tax=Hexamita inflata TaxID=28002 RepID=A0AA86UI36_9EUKA|nr:Hypothetical protein HINF_LOCUS39692 [Hexamita inflata]
MGGGPISQASSISVLPFLTFSESSLVHLVTSSTLLLYSLIAACGFFFGIRISSLANGFDCSDFVQKKGISRDQLITSMNNQGLTDDQILITLAKSKLDILTFAEKKGLSNEQVLLVLVKNNIETSDFAQKKGISNDHRLAITNILSHKIFQLFLN